MRNKKIWLLLIVQVIVVLFVANINLYTERYGKEVLLKTVPYDPKDVFYGDFVTLNYEINMVKPEQITFSNKEFMRSNVYVVLEKDMTTGYWEVKKVYKDKPEIYKNQVILRGKLDYFDMNQYRVSYGLEKYYIEEGTGEKFNHLGSLDVKVKVSPFSQIITELVNK